MARSQFVWLLVFEDTTTKYIKAQTISQMMYCDQYCENRYCSME